MDAKNKLIQAALKWDGYLEKKSNLNLDDFKANAGKNNFTCFARDYQRDTGYNLQAQPWCAIFVSEMMVQAFGLSSAKRLLCGALYHYCPDGVNQFKTAGRWNWSPQAGDVIFFTNGQRAYHTGIVTDVTENSIKTIEGNTSGGSGIIENGGGVCRKIYRRTEKRIMGFGRPDYACTDACAHALEDGWVKNDYGYWYRRRNGSFPANEWCLINHYWYLFNRDGYMCTGWHRWDGKICDPDDGTGDWYFFDNTREGALEGACWHTKDNGIQEIWYVD